MWEWLSIGDWIGPSELATREQRRVQQTLQVVAATLVLLCVALIFVLAMRVPSPGPQIGTGLLAVAGNGIALVLARARRLRLASLVLLVTLGVATTEGVIAVGSIATPSAIGYVIIVMAAGLLLGPGAAVVAAFASAATLGCVALVVGEGAPDAVLARYTLVGIWSIHTAGLAAAAAFASFGVRSIQRSLAAAEASEAALTRRNRDLQAEVRMRAAVEASLRDSEERYRALIENSDDLIAEIDENGRILFVGTNRKSTLGVPPESLVGSTAYDLVHPEDRPTLRAALRQVDIDGTLDVPPLRMRHGDGSWRWVETTGAAFAGSDGGRRFVTISRDVTSRRDLERELQQAQKLEALARLAGGVAHDFNNLLTVVAGHAENLQHGERDAEDRASLVEIQEATARAAALVRQLLAFARSGSREVERLDLNAVVAQMGALLRRLIGEDIELVIQTADQPLCVEADRSQLEQILANLALNARDAMVGPGRLVVETGTRSSVPGATRAPGEGPFAVLSVTDTGAGMDEETRSRIFEPFFTTKEPGRGTGLGLSTVHGIVEQSGGHIEVESERGVGSVFRVALPLHGAEPVDRTEVESSAPRAGPPTSGTVLLVEDDPAVRRVVRYVLEGEGYTVIEAVDGVEGLALGQANLDTIDLLLTDVVLPKRSGIELRRKLLELRPGLPALMMTGYRDTTHDEVSVSGDELLWKPFRRDDLSRRIREVLEAARV